ncbi:SSI family serine proteinase inhibitor [Streptomyces sp. NPDC005423]|uniref:SSI family serine proteinase inhibitor n=1 Tax=Streptomyces sp. NPDC005423 TaxID=3155343 RepID=UPI00339E0F62
MTYTKKAALLRGALLTATVLLTAAPAPAQAAAGTGVRSDWLYLTVTHGDARSSDTRGTLLVCGNPPRGHAHAAEACAELDRAGGDIAAIPPKSVYCTMIYAPVTAHARGQWKGRPVDYTQKFSNSCALHARTGGVFALDD